MCNKIKLLFQSAIILVSVIYFNNLHGQDYRPGYIIKNDLDSVNGYIAYRSGSKNLQQCSFKETRKSRPIEFTPSELKAYGFHRDKKFQSINSRLDTTSLKKVFAQQIVTGPMSLYKLDKSFALIIKDSLIYLPSPKSRNVYNTEGHWFKNDKRYVGILNYLIKDCQLSADETSYTEGDLTHLIFNYNRCKGSNVPYMKAKPLAKLSFQIFTGYARSKMAMDLFEDISFSPSYTVMGGLGADVSSPRIFDRIFFSTEFWYLKSFYQAYNEDPFSGNIRYQDIFVDVSYLKIPIGFRYNFRHENTPYVKVGFSLTALHKITVTTWEEVETTDGTVFGDENDGGYRVKDPKGIWMAVGYERALFRKFRMFAELRYERGEGFIGTAIQSFSTLNNYNLLLGIRF